MYFITVLSDTVPEEIKKKMGRKGIAIQDLAGDARLIEGDVKWIEASAEAETLDAALLAVKTMLVDDEVSATEVLIELPRSDG